jgi:hypothetical protein
MVTLLRHAPVSTSFGRVLYAPTYLSLMTDVERVTTGDPADKGKTSITAEQLTAAQQAVRRAIRGLQHDASKPKARTGLCKTAHVAPSLSLEPVAHAAFTRRVDLDHVVSSGSLCGFDICGLSPIFNPMNMSNAMYSLFSSVGQAAIHAAHRTHHHKR